MERRKFIRNAGAATVIAATAGLTSCSSSASLRAGEILHTVIFDLRHQVGSSDAQKFLNDGQKILSKIPGVKDFQVFRQVSPKNSYQYGFSMRFENQADFDAYTAHPKHTEFVEKRWETEVLRFQESDFQTYL